MGGGTGGCKGAGEGESSLGRSEKRDFFLLYLGEGLEGRGDLRGRFGGRDVTVS